MGDWVVQMPDQKAIYKVNPFILSINRKAYQPRVVSFGPYHHGKPQLAWMEAHKTRVFHRFIDQSGSSEKEIIDRVTKMALELKDSYDSLGSKWQENDKAFVKLMVLDGCFMLEVLNVYQYETYYSENDPIFSPHGEFNVMHLIRIDMLMLENQLPMSLLLELKGILTKNEPKIEELYMDVLWFLSYGSCDYPTLGERCHHVLDLYRYSLLHEDNDHGNAAPQCPDQEPVPIVQIKKKATSQRWPNACRSLTSTPRVYAAHATNSKNAALQSPNQGGRKEKTDGHNVVRPATELHEEGKRKEKTVGHNVVRPATELHEAGVHFEKSESKSLRDITFDLKSGILKLPKFIVDDSTESIFLNLIAFERCHPSASSDITSFIEFMDRIIDSSLDIKHLSSKGIIDNFIGTDKKAAHLFNTMSKGLGSAMNDDLLEVYRNLICYSNMDRHKWRANLIQTYFRNPWAIISVIAAFVLFSLTAVQTIFTILN